MRLSVTYIFRKELDTYGSVDVALDQWDALYTPVPIIDPGRNGITEATDGTITAYS